MKIWLVFDAFYSDSVAAVFSSEKAALEYVDKMNKEQAMEFWMRAEPLGLDAEPTLNQLIGIEED